MTAALALTLVLAASPSSAADKNPAAPAPAAAQPASGDPGVVPEKDMQPNPGSDGGVSPYALKDLDAVVKEDLKRMEAESREAMRQLDAQYEAQKELETRQFKEKFDFLRRRRDARAAFEKELIADWKKFAEGLRSVEPAERGTEKLAYDQKTMERRHKFDEDGAAKNKEFLEKQQRDRDEFWKKVQQDNNDRARRQVENANTWGKPAAPR